MKNVLVIGSLNMDYLLHVDNMPKVGETIFGKEIYKIPGGKGANQAYAASKLGANVSMIGAVGDDSNGKALISNLKSVGVNVSGIEILENIKTGSAFVNVDENANNSIIVIPGSNDKLNKEIIDKHLDLIAMSDFIIVQLEIPIETVAYVVQLGKELDKKVILDPAPANENIPLDILKNVDLMKPNETELAVLTDMEVETEEEVIRAGKVLLKKGVKTLIVTRGEKGSVVIQDDKVFKTKGEVVDAVDTTGAGDCFIGALTASLSQERSLKESVVFATHASAIAVTRKGAQAAMPSLDELMNKMKKI